LDLIDGEQFEITVTSENDASKQANVPLAIAL